MNNDQLKIVLLLIAVLAVCTFFIGVGNEKDIQILKDQQDSLLAARDSLEIKLACAEVEYILTLASVGRSDDWKEFE